MSATHDSLLYARVETVLAGEIRDGDLKIGDQLPTEESLIARFGVSRITVRRAIQNLVSRGPVEIRRGKGTFVTAPKIMQDLKELSGFVEDMHLLGRKPTARVIGKEIVTANATVARQLALTRASASSEFVACAWQTAFLSPSTRPIFPWRSARRSSPTILKVDPIFSLLERKYDVPLDRGGVQVGRRGRRNRSCRALRVEPGSPIFRIERTSYSTGNRPVDYETLYYRGDLVRLYTPGPKSFSMSQL